MTRNAPCPVLGRFTLRLARRVEGFQHARIKTPERPTAAMRSPDNTHNEEQLPVTPIIVIGMNRSGTKWLSNILCNHPEVAGVQSERFTGIVETNIFETLPRKFGDLSRPDDYVAFVEFWALTEFFQIASVHKEMFYRLNPRPNNYYTLFSLLMNEVARRQRSNYWLQKTSPWHAPEALENFPEAKCLVIRRDRVDTLRSAHFLATGGKSPLSWKMIFGNILQDKILKKLERRRGAVSVRYEALRRNSEAEVARVCQQLGLSFQRDMLQVPFRKNTSFRTEQDRTFAFSRKERARIRIASTLGLVIPMRILLIARRIWGKRGTSVVPGTFLGTRDKYQIH